MPGLRAFMDRLIDYAGMFPPAQLPLDQAYNNFERYLNGPDRWMLSRFVVPATQLAALRPLVRKAGDTVQLSALGRAALTPTEFVEGIEEDVQAIVALRRSIGLQAVIDVFEV